MTPSELPGRAAPPARPRFPWLAVALCACWWAVLAAGSRMIVEYDAREYESLGATLLHQGPAGYFRGGLTREPGYPAVVGLSMLLGDRLGVSYQRVLTTLQLGVLLLTQLLLFRALLALGVGARARTLAVLYLGLSPAIVNSALSLFSEVVTYPLLLGGLLLLERGRRGLAGSRAATVTTAAAAGATFAALTLCKAVFEAVTPLLAVLLVVLVWVARGPGTTRRALLFALVTMTVFAAPVLALRLANLHWNGHFALASRGGWLLYGSAAHRAEPLTRADLLATLASIPGDGVCRSLLGAERCARWTFTETDRLGLAKLAELERTTAGPRQLARALRRATLARIGERPLQFLLLGSVQGARLLFWESTQIGYVAYPAWADRVFRWAPLKDGVRLLLAALTVAGVLGLAARLRRVRWRDPLQADAHSLALLTLVVVTAFLGLYSLFSTLTRYALPIAPLYLLAIAASFSGSGAPGQERRAAAGAPTAPPGRAGTAAAPPA